MTETKREPVSSAAMADVSGKPVTRRRALAAGRIHLGAEAFAQTVERNLPKGDALALAEVAGIQAAKQTPQLIPLCHPISLNRVSVHSVPLPELQAIEVYCLAEIDERTGVEMEALCGLSVALLTVWDLAKPVNPSLRVSDIRLLYKSGGKHGDWTHPDGLDAASREILDAP